MLRRLCVGAAALPFCMAFVVQPTLAAGQAKSQVVSGTHFNGSSQHGIPWVGKVRRAHRTQQIGSAAWGWGFYDNPFYYGDPVYFSECYRRTRIETLYWVTWRPVRVCNR
jgi:hypothetical protein